MHLIQLVVIVCLVSKLLPVDAQFYSVRVSATSNLPSDVLHVSFGRSLNNESSWITYESITIAASSEQVIPLTFDKYLGDSDSFYYANVLILGGYTLGINGIRLINNNDPNIKSNRLGPISVNCSNYISTNDGCCVINGTLFSDSNGNFGISSYEPCNILSTNTLNTTITTDTTVTTVAPTTTDTTTPLTTTTSGTSVTTTDISTTVANDYSTTSMHTTHTLVPSRVQTTAASVSTLTTLSTVATDVNDGKITNNGNNKSRNDSDTLIYVLIAVIVVLIICFSLVTIKYLREKRKNNGSNGVASPEGIVSVSAITAMTPMTPMTPTSQDSTGATDGATNGITGATNATNIIATNHSPVASDTGDLHLNIDLAFASLPEVPQVSTKPNVGENNLDRLSVNSSKQEGARNGRHKSTLRLSMNSSVNGSAYSEGSDDMEDLYEYNKNIRPMEGIDENASNQSVVLRTDGTRKEPPQSPRKTNHSNE